MLSERQRIEAAPTPPSVENTMPPPPAYEEVNGIYASQTHNGSTDSMGYFLGEVSYYVELVLNLNMAEDSVPILLRLVNLFCFLNVAYLGLCWQVMHPYQAESDVELTLSVGDYVVVRKVYGLPYLNHLRSKTYLLYYYIK